MRQFASSNLFQCLRFCEHLGNLCVLECLRQCEQTECTATPLFLGLLQKLHLMCSLFRPSECSQDLRDRLRRFLYTRRVHRVQLAALHMGVIGAATHSCCADGVRVRHTRQTDAANLSHFRRFTGAFEGFVSLLGAYHRAVVSCSNETGLTLFETMHMCSTGVLQKMRVYIVYMVSDIVGPSSSSSSSSSGTDDWDAFVRVLLSQHGADGHTTLLFFDIYHAYMWHTLNAVPDNVSSDALLGSPSNTARHYGCRYCAIRCAVFCSDALRIQSPYTAGLAPYLYQQPHSDCNLCPYAPCVNGVRYKGNHKAMFAIVCNLVQHLVDGDLHHTLHCLQLLVGA
jgi:hypothetical protein